MPHAKECEFMCDFGKERNKLTRFFGDISVDKLRRGSVGNFKYLSFVQCFPEDSICIQPTRYDE
jgi:hypothetical protein